MSSKKFKVEALDVDKLVKTNDLKEITNPVFFNKFGSPTSDGLLSNEIFGITKNDRADTYAYIDLGGYFISPPLYKAWVRLDSKLNACVTQHGTFSISKEGKLIPDEKGSNGLKWLKENINKFKWVKNDSFTHNNDIEFINKFKSIMFINKFPVIPAYYRDVQTSNGNRVDVGIVNKLYNSLILACKSLKDSSSYGLTLNGLIEYRIQSILVEIYNWFGEEPQIGKKFGILRRANMAKTTDYSSRLVMTCPQLNVEDIEDLNVDPDHAAIPLASLAVNFFPFVIFHMRRFFENQFSNIRYITNMDDGKEYEIDNWEMFYSDDELKKQIDRFVHGYSNRFIKVEIPVKASKIPVYMAFKGKSTTREDAIAYMRNQKTIDSLVESSSIIDRYMTWCDIIYLAVSKAIEGKMVLFTRYPIDTYFNQIPLEVNISSTLETEPVILNGVLYKNYPKIRDEYIGIDTSNMFIDTMNLFNGYLKTISGDYDGDTCSVRGIYSEEANKELKEQKEKLLHWIGTDGNLAVFAHAQAIDATFALTVGVPGMKPLSDPEF